MMCAVNLQRFIQMLFYSYCSAPQIPLQRYLPSQSIFVKGKTSSY